MILWAVLMVVLFVAMIAGMVYLITRIRKSTFMKKLAGGSEKKATLLSTAVITGAVAFFWLLWGFINAVIILPVSYTHLLSGEEFIFRGEGLEAHMSRKTGFLTALRVDGKEYLKGDAGRLKVLKSDKDPWGMNRKSYRETEGYFELLTGEEEKDFTSSGKNLEGLRIIEDGEVRTVVEAVFCLLYTSVRQPFFKRKPFLFLFTVKTIASRFHLIILSINNNRGIYRCGNLIPPEAVSYTHLFTASSMAVSWPAAPVRELKSPSA